MGAVYFYHLTRSGLVETLATLIGRAIGMGWRVGLRGPDRAALERLDGQLWLTPEEGFLPHGLAGGPQDADQPVLLGLGAAWPNGARYILAVEGAVIPPAEAGAMERCNIVFDGMDPGAVEAARGQWRALTGAGIAAQYWSEESGKWQKKAEHPPAR